jgi:hypothetical protein
MHFTICCRYCGETITTHEELMHDHATCAPPAEDPLQANARAMERRLRQFGARVKLAAAGVILSHGTGTRRRRRGGHGRKAAAP